MNNLKRGVVIFSRKRGIKVNAVKVIWVQIIKVYVSYQYQHGYIVQFETDGFKRLKTSAEASIQVQICTGESWFVCYEWVAYIERLHNPLAFFDLVFVVDHWNKFLS